MGRYSVLVPIVYNALMLVGIAARDDGQGGFRSVEVDGLMLLPFFDFRCSGDQA